MNAAKLTQRRKGAKAQRTLCTHRLARCTSSASSSAFTLLEMLTVVVIIGLILAVAVPAIKGMKKSNVIAAADRQLLDDLALARQRAILGRTTVHVVFVPPTIVGIMMDDPAQ